MRRYPHIRSSICLLSYFRLLCIFYSPFVTRKLDHQLARSSDDGNHVQRALALAPSVSGFGVTGVLVVPANPYSGFIFEKGTVGMEYMMNGMYNTVSWCLDDLSSSSTKVLSSCNEIPVVGLGVYKMTEDEAYQAVLDALKAGYRHIDTASLSPQTHLGFQGAWIYRNQRAVGKAMKDSGIARMDIFLTTKFFPQPCHGYDQCMAQVTQSLQQLDTDYIDLLLVHTPGQSGDRMETWRAMEKMKDAGVVKSIGVSNYGEHHLKQLLERCVIRPTVNQIEVNPYITRRDLRDFCSANGIVVECYSPLTKGQKLYDPKLQLLAKKYNRTPAQMMIRWCLQQGCVVLPKSVRKDKIEENFDVFSFLINDDDVEAMNKLNENLVTGWDPTQEAL